MVEDAKLKAKELYNTKLYAVCSDNASNMVKMGKMSDLWHVTCSSHSGNLLAKDLVKKDLTARVNEVLKEFKRTDLENEIVKKGRKRIILSCDTRWCSYRDSFNCLKSNLTFIKQVIAEDRFKIKPNVTRLIFEDYFTMQVSDDILLFDPVCDLVNYCQKIDTNIADAAEKWLNLKLPDGYPEFNEVLETRIEKSINTYSLAANYLHPVYQGKS